MAETAAGDGRPRAVVLLEELGGPQVGNAWEEWAFEWAGNYIRFAERDTDAYFFRLNYGLAEGVLEGVKMRRELDEIQGSWRSGERSIFRMAKARAEMEVPPTTVAQSGGTKAEKLSAINYSTSASRKQRP